MSVLALLSPRVWIAVALAITLAGTHWRAYVSGKQAVQLEWDADTAQRTAAALAAEQAARAREQDLQAKTRKVVNDLQAEKLRRAAADQRAADSLQRLDAALSSAASATSPDPAAPARADDDPRNDIIAQCAGALVGLDKAYRSLAGQTAALQDYTRSVCVSPE